MPKPAPPLYGLVLVGGGSTRMGQDKAWMNYHGQAEWQRAQECIAPYVEHTYISIRADQAEDARFPAAYCITDRWDNIGPMNGIASAMHTHPDVAWCVVPCDMPGLDASIIQAIIKQRSVESWATVVENQDGQLEPMCAIYEPAAATALLESIEAKEYSLHRCLTQWPIQRVKLDQDDASLENINTPEESQRFRETHTSKDTIR